MKVFFQCLQSLCAYNFTSGHEMCTKIYAKIYSSLTNKITLKLSQEMPEILEISNLYHDM